MPDASTPPGTPPLGALQSMLHAYLDGETGIPFEALARFAEPLFALYEMDLRAELAQQRTLRDADELASLLAVLDVARLLWTFFALSPDARRVQRPQLEACLTDPDDPHSFQTLLTLMEAHWQRLGPDLQTAQVDGFAQPDFDVLLLEHTTAEAGPAPGVDPLNRPEAFALFARPLLDDPAVQQDADALEQALARAEAYWELAQASPDEWDRRLNALRRDFAATAHEAQRLAEEARTMVARFFELFPEQRDR